MLIADRNTPLCLDWVYTKVIVFLEARNTAIVLWARLFAVCGGTRHDLVNKFVYLCIFHLLLSKPGNECTIIEW